MDVFVTIVVQDMGNSEYAVYIPDLNLTQYGPNRIIAMGEAIQVLRAVARYRQNNGIDFVPSITTEEAQVYCKSKKDFVTVAAVSTI